MKKISLFLFLLFAITPTNLFAGDYAQLNFIGFSRDANYLAFEEYGEQDGSGFPYSNYFFVNTSSNKFAETSVNVRIDSETSSIAAARARAKALAVPKLRKLGIVHGNRGDLLVFRVLTDLSVKQTTGIGELTPVKVNFARKVWSMYAQGDYELTLMPSEAKDKQCESYGETVYKIELTLKDNQTNTTTILQKDESLPESRGCPLYYGIQSVYWYGDRLAIFVQVYTIGFEGPDMRFMAVTGNVTAPSN